MTGTRSGMSWALISKPASLSDCTVAALVERTMRGAKARKRGKYVAVALCGAQGHTLDGDGVGADGAGTQPKGGVGPVAFDSNAAGRAIRATAHAEVCDFGLAVPGGNTLDVDLDAKGLHGLDGQVDIGGGSR